MDVIPEARLNLVSPLGGYDHILGTFTTKSGSNLYNERWQPASITRRANIHICVHRTMDLIRN